MSFAGLRLSTCLCANNLCVYDRNEYAPMKNYPFAEDRTAHIAFEMAASERSPLVPIVRACVCVRATECRTFSIRSRGRCVSSLAIFHPL